MFNPMCAGPTGAIPKLNLAVGDRNLHDILNSDLVAHLFERTAIRRKDVNRGNLPALFVHL